MMTVLIGDTVDALIQSARDGRLTKHALTSLLAPEARRTFLAACAEIERRYTTACAAGDPCLDAGCACEGETCLQPLLRAGTEYLGACGAEWAKLFVTERNRDVAWRVTAGGI